MRRSQQAFSAPSKQTQSSNAKDDLSSTASINASSTTLIPSSELLASKPRDSTLKREQNSCYEHDNGLMRRHVRTRRKADMKPLDGNSRFGPRRKFGAPSSTDRMAAGKGQTRFSWMSVLRCPCLYTRRRGRSRLS